MLQKHFMMINNGKLAKHSLLQNKTQLMFHELNALNATAAVGNVQLALALAGT